MSYYSAMKQYADILASDRDGRTVLIVEAKSKRGTNRRWAAEMRRNMYAHGLLPDAPYFLLALPDAFYLWKNTGGIPTVEEPTFQIDPGTFLRPYYESSGIEPESVTGASFEYIVSSWLNQIMLARDARELDTDARALLVDSGLFEMLAGGHLELDVAA